MFSTRNLLLLFASIRETSYGKGVIITSRDFVYWLQGFFELQGPKKIRPDQVELIKKHLEMVFVHEIDPAMGNPEHQKKLSEIHSGKKAGEQSKTIKTEPPKMDPEALKRIDQLLKEAQEDAQKKLDKPSQWSPWPKDTTIRC